MEQEQVWRNSWVCVGPLDKLRKQGDTITTEVLTHTASQTSITFTSFDRQDRHQICVCCVSVCVCCDGC